MKKLIVLVFLLTSLFVSPSLSSAEGTWKKIKPNLDINKGLGVEWNQAPVIQLKDGRVMVIGNKNSFIYNYKKNKWSKAAPSIRKGIMSSPVLLQDGRVLVFTGSNSKRDYERAEIYNPKTNKWKLTGKLNRSRGLNVQAVVLPNGKVMMAEGTDHSKNQIEIYDPKTNKWSKATNMNYPAGSIDTISFLPLKDGKILAMGGRVVTKWGDTWFDREYSASVEIYNPKTNKWTEHDINSDLNVSKKLFYLSDGTIFFIGDYSTGIYNFDTKKFKELTSLTGFDFDCTDAVEMKNGKVLITGSDDATNKPKPKGYIYTLKTKKLEKLKMPSIIEPYLFELPNGKILVLSTANGIIVDWNTMYLYTPSK